MAAPIGYAAPNVKWYVNNKCGEPAVGGFIYTTSSITGAPQPTYNSAFIDITTQNPNPMRIGSDGASEFSLFWAVGDGFDSYVITEYDANGNLIFQGPVDPVSSTGGGGSINVSINTSNYGRNEQFSFWNFGTSFVNTDLPIGTTQIADDWTFQRSNTNADITISRYEFAAGSPDYPFSPAFACNYTVTTASSDSFSDIGQSYQSVQTLNNRTVTIVIRGQTLQIGQSVQVSLVVTQNFGSGGSLPIETIVDTYTFDDTENSYSTTFTVPNIAGNNIGPNGDDYLRIAYRMNPSATQSVIMTCYQFQSGQGTGQFFPYETENDQYVRLLPVVLAGHEAGTGTDIIGTGSITTPTAQGQNLTQYLQQSIYTAGSGNALIGWNFPLNPNQLGNTINAVANAAYIADQTILLSDGNGAVNKTSSFGEPLMLEVAITGKKFGIFQIIENCISNTLRNSIISAATLCHASNSITAKIAILGWNGSSNMQLKNPILAWESPGTNPTLNAGWNYIGSPSSFIATSSNQYAVLEGVNSMSNYSSYGVFIWNDSADLPVGQIFSCYYGSLCASENALLADNLDAQTVKAQCERYYQRSYPVSVATASSTAERARGVTPMQYSYSSSTPEAQNISFPVSFPNTQNSYWVTTASIERIDFLTEMWKLPTIFLYNSNNGAAGTAYWGLAATTPISTGTQNISISSSSIDEKGFLLSTSRNQVEYVLTAVTFEAASPLLFHYVANAQLGV